MKTAKPTPMKSDSARTCENLFPRNGQAARCILFFPFVTAHCDRSNILGRLPPPPDPSPPYPRQLRRLGPTAGSGSRASPPPTFLSLSPFPPPGRRLPPIRHRRACRAQQRPVQGLSRPAPAGAVPAVLAEAPRPSAAPAPLAAPVRACAWAAAVEAAAAATRGDRGPCRPPSSPGPGPLLFPVPVPSSPPSPGAAAALPHDRMEDSDDRLGGPTRMTGWDERLG